MKRSLGLVLLVLAPLLRLGAAPEGAEALLVVAGDMHSAYDRTAQFVALVDRLRADHPGLPVAVLLNGDTQEYGNGLARRSAGAIDFALYAALARRAPTILNLGNHEADYLSLEETVARAEAAGVRVVSNAVNRGTGRPFAPASVTLRLAAHDLVLVGLATDALSTYRVAVRPSLALAEPVAWARRHFPELLAPAGESGPARRPVILSHCGLAVDKELLALVPDGTLFAGAHSHLRLIEPFGRTVYFHAGAWTQHAALAWLCRPADGAVRWVVELVPVAADGPADPELAALIRTVKAQHQTAEDRAVIGRSSRAMDTPEAAQWVAEAVRTGAGVDAVFIGNTTFGAGLPSGEVTQAEFDACVRFDGPLFVAEVDGARLRALLEAANQGPETPFSRRRGEFNYAAGPRFVDPAGRYRIATSDWGAKNSERYFGAPAIAWQEAAGLRLKPLARAALGDAPAPP